MEPRTSVIICTTPRTGSGLLCELLWKSGVVGRPNEWFGKGAVRRDRERWAAKTDRAYVERVLCEGTTPNGVFGMKFHWSHWDRFRSMVGAFPVPTRDGRPDHLGGVFPDIRYVWLRRRDKVRQAVSRFAQRQTGISKSGDEQRRSGDLAYSFDAIDHLVRILKDQDHSWREYFGHFGRPIEITYEDDLEQEQTSVLERLAAELGWEIPMPNRTTLRRRKLSNDHSEELVRLYNREARLS